MGWRRGGEGALSWIVKNPVVDGKLEGIKTKGKLRGGSGFGISSGVIGWLGCVLGKCLRGKGGLFVP